MAEFHYHLGTHTKEQYDALDISLRDADDPTYVAREVSQTDDILHSPTRGVFWLSEEEAADLETKPEIEFQIQMTYIVRSQTHTDTTNQLNTGIDIQRLLISQQILLVQICVDAVISY